MTDELTEAELDELAQAAKGGRLSLHMETGPDSYRDWSDELEWLIAAARKGLEADDLIRAITNAYVAMKIAAALPGVSLEYDFANVLSECRLLLEKLNRKPTAEQQQGDEILGAGGAPLTGSPKSTDLVSPEASGEPTISPPTEAAPMEEDESQTEERLCTCGTAGSGEQHEPWCAYKTPKEHWIERELESFKAKMQWHSETPNDARCLVLANLNGFVGHLIATNPSPQADAGENSYALALEKRIEQQNETIERQAAELRCTQAERKRAQQACEQMGAEIERLRVKIASLIDTCHLARDRIQVGNIVGAVNVLEDCVASAERRSALSTAGGGKE